ncbi:MAG TPA: molybdopterin-dependent oxidoreductase [Candidatus Elarobacter sp.]|jgi:DMSO/TMAO reductase YedYZ molybdopterin-dependent catalytic subunit|nr:molybdopterin-dependent oxidoreductase [Candidatus Elarobacter sp.]
MRPSRRRFLAGSAAAVAAAAAPARGRAETVQLPFANGDRPLAAFPQKRPLLLLTPRPPQLETPFAVFDQGLYTPNDAFYVRWHLSNIPQRVDATTHRIAVGGEVGRTLSLSLADLAKLPQVELAAVNQCSGNGRGLSSPRVAGGQWDNGAMGNAIWTGVRLRDVLDMAGLKSTAKQVQFDGLEGPVLPTTPDFRKSLDVEQARRDDVLIAYAMNGAPLPLLNGYPVRLIVPGWYATYWVKMLSSITVLDHVDDNFWMKTAYRIPDTPDNSVTPGATGFPTVPISTMRVRSFATNVADGGTLAAGLRELRGIAFDGGSGIKRVEVSLDGGTSWTDAALGPDAGKYSFRRWSSPLAAGRAGTSYTIAVRATSNDGSVQPSTQGWNPSGYLRNVIETYKVAVG